MYIKIISDPSPRAGINVGDIFEAIPYWLDQSEKFTLIRKVEGSEKPYEEKSMNHYRHNAKILRDYKPSKSST